MEWGVDSGVGGGMENLDTVYREYPTGGSLASHIVCWWTTIVPSTLTAPYVSQILPDACVDFVMVNDRPPIIAGPATIPLVVEFEPGTVIVGARFFPGLAPSWFNVAASEMLNTDVSVFDLWGSSTNALHERLATAHSPMSRLRELQTVLLDRIQSARPVDPIVSDSICQLATSRSASVSTIARTAGLSERQLRRRFHDWVGYGLKMLHRILRLQRLLQMSDTMTSLSAADLAIAGNYADQAHMSRDLRDLTDQTATEVLGHGFATLGMSDLFKTAYHSLD